MKGKSIRITFYKWRTANFMTLKKVSQQVFNVVCQFQELWLHVSYDVNQLVNVCVNIQLNLFITDTKGTGISVRIIEVSVLEK